MLTYLTGRLMIDSAIMAATRVGGRVPARANRFKSSPNRDSDRDRHGATGTDAARFDASHGAGFKLDAAACQ